MDRPRLPPAAGGARLVAAASAAKVMGGCLATPERTALKRFHGVDGGDRQHQRGKSLLVKGPDGVWPNIVRHRIHAVAEPTSTLAQRKGGTFGRRKNGAFRHAVSAKRYHRLQAYRVTVDADTAALDLR